MSKVLGIRVKLEQIYNSDNPSISGKEWVVPKKATILSGNSGTLVEAEEGGLYLVPIGDWFRSNYYGRSLPQVDAFNQLQDYGLTAIKDRIVRHEEKVAELKQEAKQTVKENGQEIRSQNNVSPKKVNQAVASNSKGEKKD
jgi:hypothetical protein